MPTEIQRLLADPLEYGSGTPITIVSGATSAVASRETLEGAEATAQRRKVRKAERVKHLTLKQEGCGATATIENDPSPGSEPVYWLPWQPDNLVQMKLPREDGDPAARIFLTATLSGCSIFLEHYNSRLSGQPRRTAIYHGNAQSYRADEAQDVRSEARLRGPRADAMRQDFDRLRRGGALHEVRGPRYQVDPNSLMPKDIDDQLRDTLRRVSGMIPGHSGKPHAGLVAGLSHDDPGSVFFGVWGIDGWQFYLQTQVTVSFEHHASTFSSTTTQHQRRVCFTRVRRCEAVVAG